MDSFVVDNPSRLPPDELALIATWKQAVVGQFYILRHLKRYTVFLDEQPPPKAYGVLGITNEISHLLPQDPPIMVETVLLPWRDKIIYDGLVHSYNVHFGPGICGSLNKAYQRIKTTTGIIETLGGSPEEQPVPRRLKKRGPSVEELLAILDRIDQEIAALRTAETPAQRGALALLRAAVDMARSSVHERADVDEVVRSGRRLNAAVHRLQTALDLR